MIVGQASSAIALDTDVTNLALSIERFDIQAHQPHPPGYLGYVLFLKVLHFITSWSPLQTVLFASKLMLALTLSLTFLAVRIALPSQPKAALWTLALVTTSPMLLYYGVDGQTHGAEAASSAALLCMLARHHKAQAQYALCPLHALLVGLLLALGLSFRPSFALFAGLPILYCYRHNWRNLALIAITAAIACLAWLLPTIHLSGGYEAYSQNSDALVGMFARKTSWLSSERDIRMTTDNLLGLALWTSILALVLPFSLWVGTRGKESRHFLRILLLMAAPALAFYALVFIAEAGYLLALVPAACVVAGIALGSSTLRFGGFVGGFLILFQLAFFFVGPTSTNSALLWTPTLSEITLRQVSTEATLAAISKSVPPTERILVLSDRGATFRYRQLPQLRGNTEVLLVHSESLTIFDETTFSLVSASNWRGAPGPSLVAPGPATTMTSTSTYDTLVLGPDYSPALREELALQTNCISAQVQEGPLFLPIATCFPGHTLSIGKHRFQWQQPTDGLVPLAL